MSQAVARRDWSSGLLGRTFVNAAFDYLLIGGGLSLFATIFLLWNPQYRSINLAGTMTLPIVLLLCNSCHFGASTVRLYTKPGAMAALPFLSAMFPLVMFALLTICMMFPTDLGKSLNSLYLTWSPYHYAAQAYGLAVMYSYRSGCILEKNDKRLLWWISMIAFLQSFFFSRDVGVHWLVPDFWRTVEAQAPGALNALHYVFLATAFVAPLLLFFKVWSGKSGPMPLISLMAVISNSVWFFVLEPRDAFIWATIFHGLQYLSIVIIFHVKDQLARPANRHGVAFHVVTFYLMCLGLGYALFRCVPLAYAYTGFGYAESTLLVVAAINVHHFIVDGYIWRLKKTDGNRKIVDADLPAPEAATAG